MSILISPKPRIQTVNYTNYLVHDYETAGIDTNYSYANQFAGILTDTNLIPIEGETTNIFCKPRLDVIPDPIAYLITRIDVRKQINEGISEIDFIKSVHNVFTKQPNTAVSGYNSNLFDNAITRATLYRNGLEPYGHEWKDGAGMVDFYNLMKLVAAFRPNCINIPKIDGKISLKLENLCPANGIEHLSAHDALSDVLASIDLARMIKEREPQLYQYFLDLSNKRNVANILSTSAPQLYVERHLGHENNYTTAVVPMLNDQNNKNDYHCIDLRYNPEVLLDLTPEQITEFQFKKKDERKESDPHIPIQKISANKQPMVKPILSTKGLDKTLNSANLDISEVEKHFVVARKYAQELQQKLKESQQREWESKSERHPYGRLYDGFCSKSDRLALNILHTKGSDHQLKLKSADPYELANSIEDSGKLCPLILLSQWTNYHESMIKEGNYSPLSLLEWTEDALDRMKEPPADANLKTLAEFIKECDEILSSEEHDVADKEIITHLKKSVLDNVDQLNNYRGKALNHPDLKILIKNQETLIKKTNPKGRELDPIDY
ncbi:exodeoxyribonuclease I [Vibrio breoganii]